MKLFSNIKSIFTKQNNDLDILHQISRMDFEYELDCETPDEEPIRLIGNPDILLSDFLTKESVVCNEEQITSSSIIVENNTIKSKYKDIVFDQYHLFEDMLSLNDDGTYDIRFNRATFLITYKNTEGVDRIVLHINIDGEKGHDMCLLNRCSLVRIASNFESNLCKKILFTFDLKDPSAKLEEIKKYRRSAQEKLTHKNCNLSKFEFHAIGMTKTTVGELQLAESLINEQRWNDAIFHLQGPYKHLKYKLAQENPNQRDVDIFFKTCYNLGYCYYRKGLFLKSIFFLQLAGLFTKSKELEQLLDKCNTLLVIQSEFPSHFIVPEDSRLSLILKYCFDIIPSELSDMIVIDRIKHIETTVKSQKEIWDYDIIDALKDSEELLLHMSYRRMNAILDKDYLDPKQDYSMIPDPKMPKNLNFLKEMTQACIDKSILSVDNNLVISLVKENETVTMSIILPRFRLIENNGGNPKIVTVKFSMQPYIDENTWIDPQPAAAKFQHIHYLFENGNEARIQQNFGDAIYFLTLAYNELMPELNGNNISDYDYSLFGEICYMLGSSYLEIQQYEMAIHYLEVVASKGSIRWDYEYINALSNSNDIRAFGYVSTQMKKLANGEIFGDSPAEDRLKYESFLKRRLVYILIEAERYDEAEKFLEILLRDKENKDFARREWFYILRKKILAKDKEAGILNK